MMAGPRGKVANAQTGDFTTYFTAPGAVHLYDGMNLAALAMVAFMFFAVAFTLRTLKAVR